MSQQFTYTLEADPDCDLADNELTVIAKLTYAGAPQRGPTYSSGGEPAEDPEWEIESIEFNGQPFKVNNEEEEKIYDFVAENWDWEEGE